MSQLSQLHSYMTFVILLHSLCTVMELLVWWYCSSKKNSSQGNLEVDYCPIRCNSLVLFDPSPHCLVLNSWVWSRIVRDIILKWRLEFFPIQISWSWFVCSYEFYSRSIVWSFHYSSWELKHVWSWWSCGEKKNFGRRSHLCIVKTYDSFLHLCKLTCYIWI